MLGEIPDVRGEITIEHVLFVFTLLLLLLTQPFALVYTYFDMAFSNLFGAKKHLIKLKSYSINQGLILGQGAFGVVFKGSDAKKNTIAAKRIEGTLHPRILTQDFDRLLQLDHPNVLKILDIEKNGSIVWMIMPLCELGDLNNHYMYVYNVLWTIATPSLHCKHVGVGVLYFVMVGVLFCWCAVHTVIRAI